MSSARHSSSYEFMAVNVDHQHSLVPERSGGITHFTTKSAIAEQHSPTAPMAIREEEPVSPTLFRASFEDTHEQGGPFYPEQSQLSAEQVHIPRQPLYQYQRQQYQLQHYQPQYAATHYHPQQHEPPQLRPHHHTHTPYQTSTTDPGTAQTSGYGFQMPHLEEDDNAQEDASLSEAFKKRMPVFAIGNTIFICGIYLFGILFLMNSEDKNDDDAQQDAQDETPTFASRFATVSPPLDSWIFFTVYWWPSCADMRADVWRLFTLQYLHANITHIMGNAIALVLFGSLLEMYHAWGMMASAVIYELSVILGSLGHSLFYPYTGLIGCSMGAYGYIGASWALIAFKSKRMKHSTRLGILALLCLQLLLDTVSFFLVHSATTSYASHLSGFTAGLLLGFGICILKKNNRYAVVGGAIACSLLLAQFLYLTIRYAVSWPPDALATPTGSGACCAEAYGYAADNDHSFDDVIDNAVCDGSSLNIDGTDQYGEVERF